MTYIINQDLPNYQNDKFIKQDFILYLHINTIQIVCID